MCSTDGPGTYKVVSAVTAGSSMEEAFTLQPGQVVYITTGAPVPNGADAVLPIEWSELPDPKQPATVRTLQAVPAGANIRPVGSDITPGTTLLHAGQLIGPAEIGLMASVGFQALHVIERPVVGVLSSGDEVIDVLAPNQKLAEPGFGQVFDSNRPVLLSLAKAAGAKVVDLGLVADDAAELEKRVKEALEKVDILVLSGGVSMGARDFVKPLLAKLGTVHFGRLNMKPGKPTTFATIKAHNADYEKLVFGLPGNPVSTLVTAQLLLVPAIQVWMRGAKGITADNHGFPQIPVRIQGVPLRPDPTRPEFHRVHVSFDGAEFTARSTGSQMSSRLLSACASNGLVLVAAGDKEVVPGQVVQCMMVGDWFTPEFGAPPTLPQRKHSSVATSPTASEVQTSPTASEVQVRAAPTEASISAGQSAAAPSSSSSSSSSSASSSVPTATAAAVPDFELRVAILTVSDRCFNGQAADLSGPAIQKLLTNTTLKNTRVTIIAQCCVPDEIENIQRTVTGWTDLAKVPYPEPRPHLIITTGGTGFSPRDITPEAIRPLLEREASGFVHAMMRASLEATPMGALSRPVAGTRAGTLILTLPGSPKAIPEILAPIINLIPHAVKLLSANDDPHTAPSSTQNKK